MRRVTLIVGILAAVAIGLVVVQRLDKPVDNAGAGSAAGGVDGLPAAAPGDGQIVAEGGGGAVTEPGAPGEDARVYRIDPAQSEVYWRIYRAGLMAAAGHNHVISVAELEGSVTVGSDLAAAEWGLSFPVNALVIDDPELRARYGEDFESVPSEEQKAGTKTNMLTDRVLNGEIFPEIRLSGRGFQGSSDTAGLPVSIQMLGRTIEQVFPATIAFNGDSLTVSGEYRLTHADLGMEPFTAFAGAMAVGDEIDFTYRIHAVAGSR
jgi:hypothetical protein